jgi:hypothetical protein
MRLKLQLKFKNLEELLKRLANSMLAAPIKFYHQSLLTSLDHLSKLSQSKKRIKLLVHISKQLLEKLYQRFQPSLAT